ncbi:AAA family ATPase [Sphingopyxis sp. BSN-002]|uniref:AAA family ATPase n=1 Tax=Sphingopyxis sp. BSN-002 TaxID=2911495 RepID=UPI001EDA2094|nr:ATP-binding protein [Sphingopyxis sp. BSN-002]UKK82774.1 AAA family ATPase [Sphingopyxis sp. BSN-002]
MLNDSHWARALARAIALDHPGRSKAGRALLGWARTRASKFGLAEKAIDRTMLLAGTQAAGEGMSDDDSLVKAARLADALDLATEERALLLLATAMERGPLTRSLAKLVEAEALDMEALAGTLTGLAPHAIRTAEVVRLDLVARWTSKEGKVEFGLCWAFERLLDARPGQHESLIDGLLGRRQAARHAIEDFPAQQREADLAIALLRGALDGGARGINILIHGPPGTGKTELARTLAAAAGEPLHAVGEADSDGDEPSRFDRVAALRLALRTLEKRGRALLLFDEMEDLLGNAQAEQDGRIRNRSGSKLFVNRLLEENVVPVIWTSNSIVDVDPAILRRFSLSIRMDFPGAAYSPAMLERVSAEEAVAVDPALQALATQAPEAASLFRVAARAAGLASDPASASRFAGSVLGAMHGHDIEPHAPRPFDESLLAADADLPALFAQITRAGAPADFSLLLTGPPGTGKTEAVQALARRLGRPLHVKRASDLISKWVGETEKRIAGAFAEAKRQGAMLFFDEVDSLLADRQGASASWEVSQVNELLTWMEEHPLPFAAATNHAAKLDPASARRFVFKVEMRPLDAGRARRAFGHFFAREAPALLDRVGGLTLGDFAVVARQMRFLEAQDDAMLVERLRREQTARPAMPQPLGFGSAPARCE